MSVMTESSSLPDQLTEAAMKLINSLADLDPVERVLVGQEVNQALMDMTAAVAQHRRAAVRELRQTYTQMQCAEMLGLSHGRIQQIENGITPRDKEREQKGDALIRKWAGVPAKEDR